MIELLDTLPDINVQPAEYKRLLGYPRERVLEGFTIANLFADQKRAAATAQATYYARQSLHDEEVRFRVGMATTHDLLQFQEEEVSAEGNQVQAEVDLENAKLALRHSEGTLLQFFDIEFQLQNPKRTPWFARF